MPTFEYQAQGADGQTVTGLVFGSSLDNAAKELSTKGMQVMRIGLAASHNDPLSAAPPVQAPMREQAVSEVNQEYVYSVPVPGHRAEGPPTEQRTYVETSVTGPLVGKVGLTHLAFFFRQLATMLEAGVPIVQSLDTLGRQSRSMKLREVIQELKGHVDAGRPISAGLQRYPEVFGPVVVSLVRAGEEGGFLDHALTLVADYLDREIQLRNLYRRVTFYPKLQIGASIIIVIGTNLILASLKPGSKGLTSPLTEITTWLWLAPLIVGLFLFFRLGLANTVIKSNWDMVGANIPFIGNTLRQIAMAKFGRAFGALYRGGVSIPKSLTLAADACGNEYLRGLMYPAVKRLEEGAGLSETLRSTNAFSPIVLDMIDTGERTGNLDHMLNKMADFYEDEAATRSTQTGLVVGVVLGLLVAVYIGYVVISFYMGYYSPMGEELKG
ncbi:MAG TPA: type II secretion system F family protein [Fimbriimonas sp.]|nr:type II secretion system F family protein [Fimbriimonas sp.]